MKKTFNYLAATAFMLASTAASATVWAPTNEDVDFIQLDPFGLTTDDGILALFDEADFGGAALEIGKDGGHVTFTASGSDWIAQYFDVNNASGGTITLTGDNNFVLGMDWGSGYVPDDDKPILTSSPDTYLITFRGGTTPDNFKTGQTLAVDVKVVPVPAAVWLFGSGLIGLVGVARRKRA